MLTSIGDLPRGERNQLVGRCLALSASSDCTRMNFGALVVKVRSWDGGRRGDLVVIGEGYNRKASRCTSFVDCCKLREQLGVPARLRGELCEAIHAEWAAIADAIERGYQVRGAELVVCGGRPNVDPANGNAWEPYVKKWRNHSCTLCARLMHAFGIARVWVPCETPTGADLLPLTPEEALVTSFKIALELVDLETGAPKPACR